MISSPPTPRLATRGDVEAMSVLMRMALNRLGEGHYSDELLAAAEKYLAIPDVDLIDDGTSYVIESGGEIVACGAWSTRQKLFTGNEDQEALTERVIPGLDAARVRAFFVHPEHARRGLGRAIYEVCHESAIAMGFCEFELMATLPGVPFYTRLGFSSLGVMDVELLDGTVLPCSPMSKSLF